MGELSAFLPIVLIFAAFYFLLIRPQSKRAKKARELQSSLAVGDKMMLTSGIFGEVVSTDDPERVDVRIADGVVVTVARAAVATVVSDEPTDVVGEKPAEDTERD